MSSKKPITVREQLCELYLSSSNIDDWIAELTALKDQHKDKINLRIDYRTHDDGYETYYRYFIVHDRPENAKERARREQAEENSKEWRRSQYEALKKEFGDG